MCSTRCTVLRCSLTSVMIETRRGSIVAASVQDPFSNAMALRSQSYSTYAPASTSARWRRGETLLGANVRGSSKIVLTLLQGSTDNPPSKLVGQVR